MPMVRVSAARFESLLANRNMTPADVRERATTAIDPAVMTRTDSDVDFADVQTLAKLFKRPWSYLVVDEPEEYNVGGDNRTFANRAINPSPDLFAELQASDFILETANELFPDSTYLIPKVTRTLPATELAAEIRSLLGITAADQLGTKDEFAALRLWVRAVHAQGVYVAQRRLKDDTIRAFSKVLGGQAVIVIDTGDSPYARIFSILHEYCHVILNSTGICDFDDHNATERYCNAVAASVLMPPSLLDRVLDPRDFDAVNQLADDALRNLSHQLRVSQASLLIRLRDLGTIDQETYEAMELRRANRRGGSGRSGGRYYPPAINKVGRLYARRVVDIFTEGVIDRQAASALLGVGEHLMPTYLSELAKGD